MATRLYIDSAAPVPAIRIVGDVDFSVRIAFAEALGSLPRRPPALAIDFTECTYFDAAVLGALAAFARVRIDQTLSLVAPGSHAKRLFRMADFDQTFAIVDTLAESATGLGELELSA